MRVAGAPAFSSIAWSHNRFRGNFFDSRSSNTRACFQYCGGTKFASNFSAAGVVSMRPMMVWDSGLICQGRNCAFAALGLRNTIGSWSWEIHPRAQLILGWVAVNQG